MTCPHDVIVADENVGTDYEPKMEVRAMCNGPSEEDCGWSVLHCEELEGLPHAVRDWWVTSSDMAHYVKQHQEFSGERK